VHDANRKRASSGRLKNEEYRVLNFFTVSGRKIKSVALPVIGCAFDLWNYLPERKYFRRFRQRD
jgi:hypothetical protein